MGSRPRCAGPLWLLLVLLALFKNAAALPHVARLPGCQVWGLKSAEKVLDLSGLPGFRFLPLDPHRRQASGIGQPHVFKMVVAATGALMSSPGQDFCPPRSNAKSTRRRGTSVRFNPRLISSRGEKYIILN